MGLANGTFMSISMCSIWKLKLTRSIVYSCHSSHRCKSVLHIMQEKVANKLNASTTAYIGFIWERVTCQTHQTASYMYDICSHLLSNDDLTLRPINVI